MISRPILRRCFGPSLLVLANVLPVFPVQAQTTVEAHYRIRMTGLPIGELAWRTTLADDHYRSRAAGGATGMLAVLVSGTATAEATGALRDGRPVPQRFTAAMRDDDETARVTMTFADGNVATLDATAPPPGQDRVPVTAAHKRDVADPLSAMLIPGAASGQILDQSICERTLRIFDGRRRYDLALRFKRMDKVKADKGYHGPAVVCAVRLDSIAGYRADSRVVRYLSGDRTIELWLVPVGHAGVLAPFRLSIESLIGTMEITADRFEITATTAMQQPAAPTASAPSATAAPR